MIRKPVVAGQFYPGDPVALREFVVRALGAGPERAALGVVSPHAGYVYSGAVAGETLGAVPVPETVVLLGPNHTGLGAEAAVWARGGWATPLGTVPVAEDLAGALLAACPILQEDTLAHVHEHSLEVQLPFLQVKRPDLRIVPICLALRSFGEIAEVGNALADTLAGWGEPALLVASSDMSHYEPDDVARAKDKLAIERVLDLDPRGLLDTAKRHGITMCGVVPTAAMLVAARRLGARGAELVRYATSGDASGDYRRVVGYAGILVA